ncbi:hypothetical protein E2C01_066369 [Portunus trituberculatus]|uniref:Uncharacterized protein n=1 Tax=Portunus trituberculatus TaxID=210409 RepID=A0A5B7HS57_PORTR|nr:hypothetical protein [Portunus trituberculatus]
MVQSCFNKEVQWMHTIPLLAGNDLCCALVTLAACTTTITTTISAAQQKLSYINRQEVPLASLPVTK